MHILLTPAVLARDLVGAGLAMEIVPAIKGQGYKEAGDTHVDGTVEEKVQEIIKGRIRVSLRKRPLIRDFTGPP